MHVTLIVDDEVVVASAGGLLGRGVERRRLHRDVRYVEVAELLDLPDDRITEDRRQHAARRQHASRQGVVVVLGLEDGLVLIAVEHEGAGEKIDEPARGRVVVGRRRDQCLDRLFQPNAIGCPIRPDARHLLLVAPRAPRKRPCKIRISEAGSAGLEAVVVEVARALRAQSALRQPIALPHLGLVPCSRSSGGAQRGFPSSSERLASSCCR